MNETMPKKDLLRPDEVAAYFSLSVRTIYAWIKEEKIEAVKICGTIRITKESVEKIKKPITEE